MGSRGFLLMVLVAAAASQLLSNQVCLVGIWAVGSLALAWWVRRRRYAYFGAVALSVPAIAHSTVENGMLEMGGILHALCAGLYALPFHCLFQRCRQRWQHVRTR